MLLVSFLQSDDEQRKERKAINHVLTKQLVTFYIKIMERVYCSTFAKLYFFNNFQYIRPYPFSNMLTLVNCSVELIYQQIPHTWLTTTQN